MTNITGRMIHEAFNATLPKSHGADWSTLSMKAQATYREMATHLNAIAQQCPFCAFFDRPALAVTEGCMIGEVPCCVACCAGPDISEMMLSWLEERS